MSGPPPKKQKYQNKKKFWGTSNKKQYLEVGQRGFLATCNFREKDCVREAYNILNQYADELYGADDPNKTTKLNEKTTEDEQTAESADIADDLEKEIAAVTKPDGKSAPKRRFQMVDTGAQNCIFIRTTLSNPNELGTQIVKDIASTHEKKSRHLLRLLPIDTVCRANSVDIIAAAGGLFDNYFLKQSYSFSIVFNKRYNNEIKREDIIRELAELVQSKNVHNRVDLSKPQRTVIVEIIKGLCCLSVVEGYLEYKKYNLVELANAKVATATQADLTEEGKTEQQIADLETPKVVESTNNSEDKDDTN